MNEVTFATPHLIENLSLLELAKHNPRLARQKLQNEIIMRRCVCGRNGGLHPVFCCHSKICVYWNICTTEHSTPYTRLDQLYKMAYERGLCECRKPKLHEIDGKIVKDYCLCVNHDCFKVFRELLPIIEDLRLYP